MNALILMAVIAVDGGAPAGGASGVHDAGTTVAAPRKPMDPAVKALVDRMQAFYEGNKDFTANFRQDYTYKAFKRTQTSTGKVTFKKPGLMRFEYEKPSPKTFVLAGDKVYAYDPEAATIQKTTINTSQLSASVTFLFGVGKLADEFEISKMACATCKGTLLQMVPLKADPRFREVRVEVDPKTAEVLRSIVIDPDGSENAITFSEMKTNTGVNADFFHIEPKPGTQVIDFTQPKGAAPEK